MPTTYKLTYFDSRGFGETARYMFALSEVKFEDNRIKSEDWPGIKQNYPLGVLPVLQVNDQIIPQSSAINHYLAREFGLLGSDSLDEARINVIYEVLVDSLQEARKVVEEKDPVQKEEKKKKFYSEILEAHSNYLVDRLKQNQGGNGFFVGQKVSLADIFFLTVRKDILTYVDKDDRLDRHPELKSLADRIAAIPNIAAWIRERPET